MSGASPVARDGVPVEATVIYDIAGPMGRAYLPLPCGHHQASLPDPYSDPEGIWRRTCRTCHRRYQITVDLGRGTALVVRLS